LGANAILAVSLAVARAAAESGKMPLYKYLRSLYGGDDMSFRLPQPTMNIINGGRHANNGLSIQEFMIIPKHKLFRERVRMGAEVFQSLKDMLLKKNVSIGVGDEGGFSPVLKNNEEALSLLVKAIVKAGYTPGKQVFLGLDMAASEFFDAEGYHITSDGQVYSAKKITSLLEKWIKKYPLVSIEDPLAEDDWGGWKELTSEIGKRVTIVGDDLFVTNSERLGRGIKENILNGIPVDRVVTFGGHDRAFSLQHEGKYSYGWIRDFDVCQF
jgi:enolase